MPGAVKIIIQRLKHILLGLLIGLIFAFMMVGGYAMLVGSTMERAGSACRVSKGMRNNLGEGFGIFCVLVSVAFVIAGVLDVWKNRKVPDSFDVGPILIVSWLWLMIGNGVLFLLLPIWLGCNVLRLLL